MARSLITVWSILGIALASMLMTRLIATSLTASSPWTPANLGHLMETAFKLCLMAPLLVTVLTAALHTARAAYRRMRAARVDRLARYETWVDATTRHDSVLLDYAKALFGDDLKSAWDPPYASVDDIRDARGAAFVTALTAADTSRPRHTPRSDSELNEYVRSVDRLVSMWRSTKSTLR